MKLSLNLALDYLSSCTVHNQVLSRPSFLLVVGVTLGDAQGLILALHSGIILGGAWGNTWDTGNQTWFDRVQGKHPTSRCTIALALTDPFHNLTQPVHPSSPADLLLYH